MKKIKKVFLLSTIICLFVLFLLPLEKTSADSADESETSSFIKTIQNEGVYSYSYNWSTKLIFSNKYEQCGIVYKNPTPVEFYTEKKKYKTMWNKFTLPEKYGYYQCGDFAFIIENKLFKINKYFVKNGIFYKIDRNGVINPDEVEKITVFSGSWFDPKESLGQNLTYGIQNSETDFLNYFSHNWAKYNIKQYETIQDYKSISEFMDSYNNQSTLEDKYNLYCSKHKTDDVFFQVDIKDFRISLIFGKDAIFKNNSLYLF